MSEVRHGWKIREGQVRGKGRWLAEDPRQPCGQPTVWDHVASRALVVCPISFSLARRLAAMVGGRVVRQRGEYTGGVVT